MMKTAMNDDRELLRRYVEHRSESAFADLVQRNLPLVYSAALRRLKGDVQAAEDVSQIVFVSLARNAPALVDHPQLAGWLYTAAHFAATKLIRTNARRRLREQDIVAMQEIKTQESLEWEQLRPLIDDAMLALKQKERDLLLLRFFRGYKLAEIGQRLEISEDAARMRIDRALERLRERLALHKVTSSAAALSVLLSNNVSSAVPAGLASTISAAAFATAAPATGLQAILASFLMSKLSTGIVVTVSAVIFATAVFELRANRILNGEIQELRAATETLRRKTPTTTGRDDKHPNRCRCGRRGGPTP